METILIVNAVITLVTSAIILIVPGAAITVTAQRIAKFFAVTATDMEKFAGDKKTLDVVVFFLLKLYFTNVIDMVLDLLAPLGWTVAWICLVYWYVNFQPFFVDSIDMTLPLL